MFEFFCFVAAVALIYLLGKTGVVKVRPLTRKEKSEDPILVQRLLHELPSSDSDSD